MTELEALRKNMKWFRSFGRALSSIAFSGEPSSEKKFLAICKLVRCCESEWPDWLNDDVEAGLYGASHGGITVNPPGNMDVVRLDAIEEKLIEILKRIPKYRTVSSSGNFGVLGT